MNTLDATDLDEKLEAAHLKLIQSEKMASIGQLAAGVAHEINNPVGYVFSNIGTLEKYVRDFLAMLDLYEASEAALAPEDRQRLQALKDRIDLPYLREDVVNLLGETREGIVRVKKIVQDLKDFSRAGGDDVWQWTDLHACLESTLNIAWNELKYKTTVRREFAELPSIYCLPSQINQVILNLLVNAAQSIAERGTIDIRTGHADDRVWFEIEDSGCGIAADRLGRIFDPFYTSKPVGKGTGLGLSVSYSIVERHEGRIEVQSEVGRGSRFRVWLPVRPAHAPAEAPATAA